MSNVVASEPGRCSVHVDRDALGACQRCGDFICYECSGFHTGTGYVCKACAARVDPVAQRGKRIVIAICVVDLAVAIAGLAVLGSASLPSGIMRFAVHVWVCWNMYQAQAWARRTYLVLASLAVAVSMVAAASNRAALADGVVFAVMACVLAFSPAVKAYFAAPRPFSAAFPE